MLEDYTFHKDPTLAAVESVTTFDELLRLSYIDLSILSPADMERNPDEILQDQLKTKPKLLAQYNSKRALAEVIRTVMLCTGLGETELQDAPIMPMYVRSCEVMGGTASDFFLEFQKITQARGTITQTKLRALEKSFQKQANAGKSNVSGSQKEREAETGDSGISG